MAFHNRNFLDKYNRIQERFKEEYKAGFRREIIFEKLKKEFYLSESRLSQILCIDVEDKIGID